MILVTVGTSRSDELLTCVDRIAELAGTRVVMQVGTSEFVPRNCEYFSYSNTISTLYSEADLVIGHGGAGTMFEILRRGKKYIGVHNRKVAGNHQVELLQKLEDEGYILWCRDPENILDYIRKSQTHAFRGYTAPPCTVEESIRQFIERNRLRVRLRTDAATGGSD